MTSGKHGVGQHYIVLSILVVLIVLLLNLPALFQFLVKETPEPFPLPTEASILKAASGWAHCVAVAGIVISLLNISGKHNFLKVMSDGVKT